MRLEQPRPPVPPPPAAASWSDDSLTVPKDAAGERLDRFVAAHEEVGSRAPPSG